MAIGLVMLDTGVDLPGRLPPSAFRIFPRGRFATEKGTFVFDDVAAASVMQLVRERSGESFVDYEHGSVRLGGPEGGAAAAWFTVELRDGELWATNVRWTPRARAALIAGEYRHVSPTFEADSATGRVTELINVALTNVPATKNPTALVSLARDAARHGKETTMTTTSERLTVNGVDLEVPGDAELVELGITREKYVETARQMVRDGSLRCELKAPPRDPEATTVAGWEGLPIEVPGPTQLAVLGISREAYIATATQLQREERPRRW